MGIYWAMLGLGFAALGFVGLPFFAPERARRETGSPTLSRIASTSRFLHAPVAGPIAMLIPRG